MLGERAPGVGRHDAAAGDATGPVRAPLLPLGDDATRELAALLEQATLPEVAAR
jgi:hypothetical protein